MDRGHLHKLNLATPNSGCQVICETHNMALHILTLHWVKSLIIIFPQAICDCADFYMETCYKQLVSKNLYNASGQFSASEQVIRELPF